MFFRLAAMAVAGLSPRRLLHRRPGPTASRAHRRPILAIAVVAGGVICGIGMFNALMMSYTRLPIAMAADGYLPRVFLRRNRRGVPWVSVLICGLGWALALKLPFERLISIDLILYGSSLSWSLPPSSPCAFASPIFRALSAPASFAFACLLGVGPTLLIGYALYASRNEKLGDPNSSFANVSALLFASVIALLGPVFYWLTAAPLARRRQARNRLQNSALRPPRSR